MKYAIRIQQDQQAIYSGQSIFLNAYPIKAKGKALENKTFASYNSSNQDYHRAVIWLRVN